MAFQYSTNLRNHLADQIEVFIGAAPVLEVRSGTVPANADAAATGTVLASLDLPADWLAAAAGGAKAKAGIWAATAAATGAASYFRLVSADGLTVVQGTVGTAGADMVVLTVDFVTGMPFEVTAFSVGVGGA